MAVTWLDQVRISRLSRLSQRSRYDTKEAEAHLGVTASSITSRISCDFFKTEFKLKLMADHLRILCGLMASRNSINSPLTRNLCKYFRHFVVVFKNSNFDEIAKWRHRSRPLSFQLGLDAQIKSQVLNRWWRSSASVHFAQGKIHFISSRC